MSGVYCFLRRLMDHQRMGDNTSVPASPQVPQLPQVNYNIQP